MSRGYQLKRLLQQLDVEIDEDDDEQFGPSWSRKNRERTVHKDELVEIMLHLDYDNPVEMTIPEMRRTLRDDGVTRGSKKSPQSEFSSSEISDLQTAVKHSVYLEADDIVSVTHPSIDPTDATVRFMSNQTITLNGTEYDIRGCNHSTTASSDTYDAYTTVLLDDKTIRLTLLHGYDNTSTLANRKHGARIDKRKGKEPYTKWRSDENIQSFEFDTSVREVVEDIEEGDVLKTDAVNTELTVIQINEDEKKRHYIWCESSRGAPYRLRYDYYRNALWMDRTSDNESFGVVKDLHIVE